MSQSEPLQQTVAGDRRDYRQRNRQRYYANINPTSFVWDGKEYE